MKRSKEESYETISKLKGIARKHFAEHGYAATVLDEIVEEANLTRGAIYHHFGSKKGLFLAVLESIQSEVAEKVESEAAKSEDLWDQLILGCHAFVTAAVEEKNKQILLIDGPAVLGWETWRSMDEKGSMRLLYEQLEMMQHQGYFESISIKALTHILSGALNESVLWIAQMPNVAESIEETFKIISLLLDRFKS
ncbi:TetR/AcrR family transcriptional regulator [Metasolibacillus sp.]|uniref:TetR/AcrR family transcriptional regulator n=1 Tax=Metasolibacillus sp. TaxID=2703680 RepID=UPI0025E680EA|nr:TetR/AcrR family transcriptional regulator [Metasolibacillus sp.]MCT6924221.1 TetR/AcrR family transcriptional regulator [Metasolibacillus sp.]MCT6940377.1 TetR/AcrR family transcriptional regulator [Metasolibacillus sp.]